MNQEIEFVLRWLHFLSGITWIGMLYYFNFVQTPFFKSCEASTRKLMAPPIGIGVGVGVDVSFTRHGVCVSVGV